MNRSVLSRWLPFLFLTIAMLGHWHLASGPDGAIGGHQLLDTDSYTRLLRVWQLVQGGGWYDNVVYKLAAPDGMPLHWTRPLDLLILGPALAAHALGADLADAVWWSGMMVCPLLHALSCLVAVWAARALWPRDVSWFAGLILFAQPVVLSYGAIGRADHHVLILLAVVACLGAGLRAAIDPCRRWMAYAAGAYGGFGIWVGPEAQLVIMPLLACFGLLFVFGREEGRALALQAFRAAAGLIGALALAILIDVRPVRWFIADYDRISILHLTTALLAMAVFGGVLVLERRTVRLGSGGRDWLRRLLLGAVLAACALVVLAACFPGFERASLEIGDPVMTAMIGAIGEMQPIRFWTRGGLAEFLIDVGGVSLALPLLPLYLRSARNGPVRRALVLLAVLAAVTLWAGLTYLRFLVEYSAVGAVAVAGLMSFGSLWFERLRPLFKGAGLLLLALATTLLLPALGRLLEVPKAGDDNNCPAGPMAEFLRRERPALTAARPAPVVLADNVNIAPRLAYETPYRFVAAPYHRGVAALHDTADVMAAEDDASARAILARREVSLVLLCRRRTAELWPVDEGTLARRLLRGDVPNYLKVVDITSELGKNFLLFEVRP
ncbi:hypothetical protein [Zavarzinia sp.]|uniref:hypothetical protein n=1 Tax=Zavarzinia sp. TaxID=2027920 RepID=UPI00356343B0